MQSSNIAEIIGLKYDLVLASRSPRRKKLLEGLGFKFRVIPADIDEDNFPENLSPREIAAHIAQQKAKHIAAQLQEEARVNDADTIINDAIVVSADTIVVLDDEILNKPTDEADAKRILRKLSDNTHTVFTGVTLINTHSKKMLSNVQASEVTFRKLDDREIDYYIASGSPMDKAGAYGIQDDFGALFIRKINGCYYNIVGLPLEMLYQMMKDINE